MKLMTKNARAKHGEDEIQSLNREKNVYINRIGHDFEKIRRRSVECCLLALASLVVAVLLAAAKQQE